MTLLQFEVFKAIVEYGSFTKAGDVLNLTQSAISHAIASLESELKVSLLNRSRTGVSLTYAGEQLFVHVQEILNHTQQIEQKAAKINGVEIGNIRVGSFPSISAELLPGMIAQFRKNNSGIQIQIFEGGYTEIEEWISSGFIDLGFVILPNKSFDIVQIFHDEYVLLLPENHPLGKKQSIDISQIADEPFIMPLGGCETIIRPFFKKRKINPNIQFEIEHTTSVIAMVKAGLGISLVPNLALKPQGIVTLKIRPAIPREIGLAVRSLQMVSPAAKVFIENAQKWLQQTQS